MLVSPSVFQVQGGYISAWYIWYANFYLFVSHKRHWPWNHQLSAVLTTYYGSKMCLQFIDLLCISLQLLHALCCQQALFFFFSIPPPFPTQIIIIIKKERDKHVHLSCLCVNFCLLNFSLSHFLFVKTLLLWFHSITRYTCSLWMLIRRCILLYSYSAHARLPLMVKVNKLKDLAFECFTGPNDCKNDIIFKPTWMFRGNHYHCCCSLHPGNALALNVPWLIA